MKVTIEHSPAHGYATNEDTMQDSSPTQAIPKTLDQKVASQEGLKNKHQKAGVGKPGKKFKGYKSTDELRAAYKKKFGQNPEAEDLKDQGADESYEQT